MNTAIITIAQQKGGTGKTTLVANLATAFARCGKKVGIIDIDPQATLTRWFHIRRENAKSLPVLHHMEASGWRVHNEVAKMKEDVELIFIDSPPHTETETKTAIRAADLVLIPAQASIHDIWATEQTVEIATKERIPHRIILNRMIAKAHLTQTLQSRFSNTLKTTIGNRVPFIAAAMQGKGVIEDAPSSPAAKEIFALQQEISQLLFPQTEILVETNQNNVPLSMAS